MEDPAKNNWVQPYIKKMQPLPRGEIPVVYIQKQKQTTEQEERINIKVPSREPILPEILSLVQVKRAYRKPALNPQ